MDKISKNAIINIRCTEEYKKEMETYAQEMGLDLSSYMRWAGSEVKKLRNK